MMHLEIKNISMKYERKYILDELSLIVEKGELLVLLGESGCGKTTLLKIVAGLINAEKGKIFIEGNEITKLPPQRRNIGYVPQAQVLFPHMTVEKNISFGLESRKLEKNVVKEKIRKIAELTEVSHLLTRFPHELSGGQKQRVALARALVVDPEILLLDEPLSSIDASGREKLALTIRRIQKETQTTTIYVTHSHEEARLICDKVGVMYDGKIQQLDTIKQVDDEPLNYLVAQIMGMPNIWQIFDQKTLDKRTIINTVLGIFEFPFLIERKFTSIYIPPTSIQICFQEASQCDERLKYKIIEAFIKSIVKRTSEISRIICEIRTDKIDYMKVDMDLQELNETDLIYKKVILKIDLEKVQFI